jgi:hypothetical protein
MDNNLILTPGYQDTMARQRIREWLGKNGGMVGLSDFRGLVGADQSFMQEELMRLESEYVANLPSIR